MTSKQDKIHLLVISTGAWSRIRPTSNPESSQMLFHLQLTSRTAMAREKTPIKYKTWWSNQPYPKPVLANLKTCFHRLLVKTLSNSVLFSPASYPRWSHWTLVEELLVIVSITSSTIRWHSHSRWTPSILITHNRSISRLWKTWSRMKGVLPRMSSLWIFCKCSRLTSLLLIKITISTKKTNRQKSSLKNPQEQCNPQVPVSIAGPTVGSMKNRQVPTSSRGRIWDYE